MSSVIVRKNVIYHLLIFQYGDEHVADIIPVHWYDEKKNMCFWPPDSRDVKTLVETGEEAHPDWNICRVTQILSPNIRKYILLP